MSDDVIETGTEIDRDYITPEEHTHENTTVASWSANEYTEWQQRPLDFSPDSSALDETDTARDTSQSHYTGNTDYRENATEIGGDLPARSRDSLNDLNKEARPNGPNHDEQSKRHQKYREDVQRWGRFIELDDYEIERAVHLFEQAPLNGRRGNGIDAVVLAALTMAANEDMGPEPAKIIRRSAEAIAKDPDTDLEWFSELVENYEQLRTDLGVSSSKIRNARNNIRHIVTNNSH